MNVLGSPDTRPARFFVVEGIDGAGTTTQVHRLFQHLLLSENGAFVTHEPSDGPAGMLIRLALAKRLLGPNFDFHDESELVESSGTALDGFTLALLFAADRADHIATQIRPNLQRLRHVVTGRYLLSSLAYQGLTCELAWLLEINRHALRPDLTFFLDVDPDTAHRRMRRTRWKRDLFEKTEQQRHIRRVYHGLIDQEIPQVGPVVVIDASRTEEEVATDIAARATRYLETGSLEAVEAVGELTLL